VNGIIDSSIPEIPDDEMIKVINANGRDTVLSGFLRGKAFSPQWSPVLAKIKKSTRLESYLFVVETS
jgi:hypothetical protein